MIIKAGTYRFNDVVDTSSDVAGSLPFVVNDFDTTFDDIFVTLSIPFTFENIIVLSGSQGVFYKGSSSFNINANVDEGESTIVTASILVPFLEGALFGGYDYYGNYSPLAAGLGQIITITEDTEVSDEFYEWFIKNAVYRSDKIATMPYVDYVNACNSIRAKTGKTEPIKSGDMASEILSIVSGGASAYHVSSVDELPSDAVDGSMAVVENDDILGGWFLNAILNFPQTGFDWYFDCEFTDANGTNQKVYNVYSDDGETIDQLFYCLEDDTEITTYALNISPSGWGGLEYRYLNITSIPNAEAEAWIRANGKKTKSLYTRENGEWVYKCEVA